MNRPLITCVMPTYNRVIVKDGKPSLHHLNTAVECFLRQLGDIDAELLVFNDTPDQQLRVGGATRNIRVINSNTRFATLGDKCNAATTVARGEWLTRWDDDDIHFPSRLQTMLKAIEEPETLSARFRGYYYWSGENQVFYIDGSYMMCDVYHRKLFIPHGGPLRYESRSTAEDLSVRRAFDKYVQKGCNVVSLKEQDAMYLYNRYATDIVHVSQYGETEAAYAENGYKPIATGVFDIEPHWDRDWPQWISQVKIPRPPVQ